MKDRYLHFQLKWHINHCSLFLVDRNQDLMSLGLQSSDSKVVLVRARWTKLLFNTVFQRRARKHLQCYFHLQFISIIFYASVIPYSRLFSKQKFSQEHPKSIFENFKFQRFNFEKFLLRFREIFMRSNYQKWCLLSPS